MRRIVVGIVIIVMAIALVGCGIKVPEQTENKPKTVTPKEKTFQTSDKKYSIVADDQWENDLKKYKKQNKDMTLMISKKMLFAGIISKKKSQYDGVVSIKNVKDYADVIVNGMEAGTKNFNSTEIMTTSVGEYDGYYADATMESDSVKLAYRMYFADTGKQYVELIFWTDNDVFPDNEATIEKLAQSFKTIK